MSAPFKKTTRLVFILTFLCAYIITATTPAQASASISITYSSGNTVLWDVSDFYVTDASTNSTVGGSHGDAYDNGIQLAVCANASCTTNTGSYTNYSVTGTYDSTAKTYNGSTQNISDLVVSAKMRFSSTIVAGRLFASFQNTSGSAITRVVRIFTDLGSDSNTYLKYTSSNQTISNKTIPINSSSNYWTISAQDSSITATAQSSGDPVNSFVWGTPGASVVGTNDFTNGNTAVAYTVTVPANSTKSLLFLFGLGEISSPANTLAGALSGVKTYLDAFSKLPSDLTSDLSGSEIASIQNWVVAPSPSTFTSGQASPTNTSSSFTYSMEMTQSITGLASGDFSNAGTATGCSFAPNSTAGTSFVITVSGCSEGTVRPQLLANTVTSTELGPVINSPASSTIVIDRTAPTIATVSATNGNYQAASNDDLNLSVVFDESVTVSGSPRLALTIGSVSRYADFVELTDSKTATFRFNVVVDYDAIDLDGISVSSPLELNSGNIIDLAGNAISSLTFTPPTTNSVNVYQPPSAPAIDSITANNGSLTIFFSPGAANGSTVSNYKYSLNSGTFTALSPSDTSSPITIPGLTNGTNYQIQLKAVSNLGDGLASSASSAAPTASANVSISLTASATTAVKGTSISITAQVSQAGSITFMWNGKRISGCIKKGATVSATCIWKPSVTGQWSIQAMLDPIDATYVDSYSEKLSVFIYNRSGTR